MTISIINHLTLYPSFTVSTRMNKIIRQVDFNFDGKPLLVDANEAYGGNNEHNERGGAMSDEFQFLLIKSVD